MGNRDYYEYIMTNKNNNVLYTGVTNNLRRRVLEHRSGKGSVFTKKDKKDKLVYFEISLDVSIAIEREKQIKAGSRKKKIDLIYITNPEWKDMYKELFG